MFPVLPRRAAKSKKSRMARKQMFEAGVDQKMSVLLRKSVTELIPVAINRQRLRLQFPAVASRVISLQIPPGLRFVRRIIVDMFTRQVDQYFRAIFSGTQVLFQDRSLRRVDRPDDQLTKARTLLREGHGVQKFS